jgi:hypothetical protein
MYLPSWFKCNDAIRWYVMHDFTSTLKSNKRKWVLQPHFLVQCALLYQYLPYQHQATMSSYAYQRKMQRCKYCNGWTSYTSSFSIKRNTTIDDKVYFKLSKLKFIYQVIWLMWILKLNGGNSNNEWKCVDHGAIFTCLRWLRKYAKCIPDDHHLLRNQKLGINTP